MKAVLAERERCLKIAENPDNLAYPEGRAKWTAEVIAKQIKDGDGQVCPLCGLETPIGDPRCLQCIYQDSEIKRETK